VNADERSTSDPLPGVDSTKTSSARVWNYWVGGKDNYAVDREFGDQIEAILPSIVQQARADRDFIGRAVKYLVAEAGIRQFLDIGTGLPTADNTHEVAQRIAPESRIVYVDNDPMVLAHARALLTSSPEGRTAYIDADLSDPAGIVEQAAGIVDFEQPVAIMLVGILHHIEDTEESYSIARRLVEAVPSGSYLVINHATDEIFGEASRRAVQHHRDSGAKPTVTLRAASEIARYFDGLDLVEPGLVTCSRWRAQPGRFARFQDVDEFAGVARKR
jgi:S-adenosyl methyltransferase